MKRTITLGRVQAYGYKTPLKVTVDIELTNAPETELTFGDVPRHALGGATLEAIS